MKQHSLNQILKLVEKRQSSRGPFNPHRKVSMKNLTMIIEATRWAPTAHNMQNFEIFLVDDERLLKTIGNIQVRISETFLRENYNQMSFSKEELLRKKVGVLGTMFPPLWRDPSKLHMLALSPPRPLSETIQGSPSILIVTYDPRKRAPASKGDFLGILSLGCVMENMWLVAQSLGIGFQVISVFSGKSVESKLKSVLRIPKYMKIAYAIRLGYPTKPNRYLRVRLNTTTFVHHNVQK
ncbi:MAG: nitroreductase family protein [Nitrososphaerota archaeon]|nr:nitroreductase family protein [Nitrososphaerota archaeon]